MIVQSLAFYLFAAILVAAAVMVISARNPVHSVLWLILSFFSAAGLFVLLARLVGTSAARAAGGLAGFVGQPAILAGGLNGRGCFHRLAKDLHRYTRGRCNMILRARRRGCGRVCVLASVTDHLAVSLSLAFSASG